MFGFEFFPDLQNGIECQGYIIPAFDLCFRVQAIIAGFALRPFVALMIFK